MGVDLRGGGRDLHLGWPAWSYCLDVAEAFGWQPEGTRPAAWVNSDGSPCEEMNSRYADWNGGLYEQRAPDCGPTATRTPWRRRCSRHRSAGSRRPAEQRAVDGFSRTRAAQPSWNKLGEILAQSAGGTVHTTSASLGREGFNVG